MKPSPLKIAQIIPTLDRSGAEKQMLLLCQALKARGHDVQVAALTRLGPLADDYERAGIPVTLIGKPLKIDPFALRRLAGWLKKGQFDVVQSWIFAANSYTRTAARLAFGRNRKKPVVIATEMAVDLWKSPWHFKIDRKLAQWCNCVVGNSHAVVDFYQTQVGLGSEKLHCIYSGIESTEANAIDDQIKTRARQELQLAAEDGPVLLFAGRLAEQKRVLDLLKAVDILQHLYPRIRLLIAGDGPLKNELIAFAEAVELKDKALFLGLRQDMARLYAAADIVVLPSSYEGLPNVVMEAQLRGLAVVAAAAPGTTELVHHQKTGLTYPIGDSTELARLLDELISNPEKAKTLGRQGREMIVHEFSVDLMADRFISLYENLLK